MNKIELHQIAIAKEVFFSLLKWFVIVLIANNILWAAVHYYYIRKSFEEAPITSISATQETVEGNNTITQGDK